MRVTAHARYDRTDSSVLAIAHVEARAAWTWSTLDLQITFDRFQCMIVVHSYLSREATSTIVTQISSKRSVSIHVYEICGLSSNPVI